MKYILLALLTLSSVAQAEGWLKTKIKERIQKRLAEKDAPAAGTDVETKLTEPGDYTFKLAERYYKLHLPKNLSPSAPMVLALHGGAGNMNVQSNEDYYHLVSKSEESGAIVVFPNGFSKFKSGQLATWNAGKCCGDARDEKSDDVGFLKKLISQVQRQVSIDPQRIFATGMSNGGMMAYRLACELSEIRAIAAVAGTDNTTECHPAHPVAVLHIHAKDDDHVLFNGGIGPGSPNPQAVNEFTSVASTIKKWREFNGCGQKSTRLGACEIFEGCQAPVKLCVTEDGGHSWPGGKKPLGGSGSKSLSATDTIWDFFAIMKTSTPK